MVSGDSQIDKVQRGRPKRAELPDVNINTGAQSSNTERLLPVDKAKPSELFVRHFTSSIQFSLGS